MNEFIVDDSPDSVVYVCIRKPDGKVYDTTVSPYHSTNSWVVWVDGNIGDYDVATTHKGGGMHVGDFPAAITDKGKYLAQARRRLGAEPDADDIKLGGEMMRWSGSHEVTAETVLLNKAVQDKSTGAVEYYDDIGGSVILTHTPSDGESTLTRQPS